MRKLIIGLVCLAAVAVLADFSAAAYAEYRVSRALRIGAELSEDPAVTFHGFPFVAQAADGTYRNIEIRATEVRKDVIGTKAIVGRMFVGATLYDVRMPLGRLVDGTVRGVEVGEVRSEMRIDPTELGQLLGISDLQVSSTPADKSDGTNGSGGSGMTTSGPIVLMGTVPVQPLVPPVVSPGPFSTSQGLNDKRVSVQAQLTLSGNQLHVVATNLYSGSDSGKPDTPVPDSDLPDVLRRFTKVIDFQPLPFGLTPTKVTAQGGQIVIQGKGKNMAIALDKLQLQKS